METTVAREALNIHCTVAVPGACLADLDITYDDGTNLSVTAGQHHTTTVELPMSAGELVDEDSISAKWDKALQVLLIDLVVLQNATSEPQSKQQQQQQPEHQHQGDRDARVQKIGEQMEDARKPLEDEHEVRAATP